MHFAMPLRADVPGAREECLGHASTRVGAHEIKRTPNFGLRTHGAYVQPTIFVFFQKI